MKMKIIASIIYTLFATSLFFLAVINSLLELSYSLFFFVCLVFGAFLVFLFRGHDEPYERISLIYLPMAGITAAFGTLANIISFVLTRLQYQLESFGQGQNMELLLQIVANITNNIHLRAIPIELGLLTVGLLGPFVVDAYYRKGTMPWKEMLRDVLIVAAVFVAAFVIEQFSLSNLVRVIV